MPVREEEASEYCQTVNRHVFHAFPLEPASLQSESNHFFWALSREQRVGTTGFTRRTPRLCEIRKTMVIPQFRGQGLGRLLCLELERLCGSMGIYKVYATVFSTNTAMLALRLKLGYTVEGYHPDHEAPGFHEYTLGKVLGTNRFSEERTTQ